MTSASATSAVTCASAPPTGRSASTARTPTVAAKTAYGDVRIGEVTRGAVVAQTACGKVDIGIRDGVAAWLDLNTGFGTVRNELSDAPRPGPDDTTVEVRGRTGFGDITIRRSVALAAAGSA